MINEEPENNETETTTTTVVESHTEAAPEPDPVVPVHEHEFITTHLLANTGRIDDLCSRVDRLEADLAKRPTESEALENARDAAITETAVIGEIVAATVEAATPDTPVVIENENSEGDDDDDERGNDDSEGLDDEASSIPEPDVSAERQPIGRRQRRFGGLW